MRSVIEEAFLRDIAEARYGSEPEAMATEMAGGVEPKGAKPMTIKQFATTAADVPAGLLKGAVQGTVGLAGDIESIVYGVRELINRGAGEGRLDAFLRGIEQKTVLPTTENVKQWLDKNAGPLVPAGVTDERRRQAAKTAEFVGELGGAGQIVVESAKASARGAKAAKDAVVDTLKTAPRGSIKLAPDLEVEIAPAERTKNFKNWFGGSKVVDEKGNPLIMYHGTSASFDEFGTGPRGAIFVTTDPNFASGYAGGEAHVTVGQTPNIMPLYVKASNPFDYNNPEHVKKIQELIPPTGEEWFDAPIRDLASGDWATIELKAVQNAIKKAGFDAFYVMEDGVRNLGVFDPKQIKSAIGNKGTFDPTSASVVRGAAATPVAPAVMQDEEKK
jgi:hypothetical protein